MSKNTSDSIKEVKNNIKPSNPTSFDISRQDSPKRNEADNSTNQAKSQAAWKNLVEKYNGFMGENFENSAPGKNLLTADQINNQFGQDKWYAQKEEYTKQLNPSIVREQYDSPSLYTKEANNKVEALEQINLQNKLNHIKDMSQDNINDLNYIVSQAHSILNTSKKYKNPIPLERKNHLEKIAESGDIVRIFYGINNKRGDRSDTGITLLLKRYDDKVPGENDVSKALDKFMEYLQGDLTLFSRDIYKPKSSGLLESIGHVTSYFKKYYHGTEDVEYR